jgi:hypothetical protein
LKRKEIGRKRNKMRENVGKNRRKGKRNRRKGTDMAQQSSSKELL